MPVQGTAAQCEHWPFLWSETDGTRNRSSIDQRRPPPEWTGTNEGMDCVGGEMAGDSSGWDSTSVSSADSAVLGSLSARTLGRRPMTRANTSSKAKSRLWIFSFVWNNSLLKRKKAPASIKNDRYRGRKEYLYDQPRLLFLLRTQKSLGLLTYQDQQTGASNFVNIDFAELCHIFLHMAFYGMFDSECRESEVQITSTPRSKHLASMFAYQKIRAQKSPETVRLTVIRN